ncbi:MAG: hypothetical protein EOP00_07320 [Pedobacter sp.]|nr:MAG: hypothetical protein EOP00_07320 [Pedobacter sp.]
MEDKEKVADKKTENKSSSPYKELYGKDEKKVDKDMKGAGDFGSAAKKPGPESNSAEEEEG